MQQCMTGFATAGILCYQRLCIRELERENTQWLNICEHLCVGYKERFRRSGKHKPGHYYHLMTWKALERLNLTEGWWKLEKKGQRVESEERRWNRWSLEKWKNEGERERRGLPCRAVWLAVRSCSVRRPWLAKQTILIGCGAPLVWGFTRFHPREAAGKLWESWGEASWRTHMCSITHTPENLETNLHPYIKWKLNVRFLCVFILMYK